jgi:tetratricopeptide (TPR) repeat protein
LIVKVQQPAGELLDAGRFTQAADLLAGFLAVEPERAGVPVARARGFRLNLASALLLGGDYARALPEYERVGRERAAERGPDDELVVHCRYQAATCHAAMGEVTRGLQEFQALLADREQGRPADDPEILDLRRQVGLLLASSGDLSGARATLAGLLRDLERTVGSQHPDVADLGRLLDRLGDASSGGAPRRHPRL